MYILKKYLCEGFTFVFINITANNDMKLSIFVKKEKFNSAIIY